MVIPLTKSVFRIRLVPNDSQTTTTETLSVIWWLHGPADNCAPPISKNIMEFGARGAGLCGLGNLEKYF